jgi:hypothetical protein
MDWIKAETEEEAAGFRVGELVGTDCRVEIWAGSEEMRVRITALV